jgi:hypothetical protein
MAVHHQEEQVISCALPATLSSFKESLNLSLVEEVLPPMRISDRTLHITRNGISSVTWGFQHASLHTIPIAFSSEGDDLRMIVDVLNSRSANLTSIDLLQLDPLASQLCFTNSLA